MNDDAPTRVPPAGSASVREPDRRSIPEERYSIRGVQGRGGQSMVYLAYDQFLGREVALKQLLPGAAGEPTIATAGSPAAARFLREARVAGQLEHPNIVPIYELGRSGDGSWYCTQRLIRGRTLLQALRESSGLADRLTLLPHFIAVCHAVAYAHSRGVIHRDIKPANVMVGQSGETVLLDWGLAKLLGQPEGAEASGAIQVSGEDSDAHTQLGHAVGTPAYMSPEQARGQVDEIDERSDIWSLGVLLAFAPDGALASAGADGTIRLWHAPSGRPVARLADDGQPVDSLAFAPDGRSFVSGGDDRWIRRWDAGDGTALSTLVGHQHWVESLAFSPDGITLLSGGFDTVRLWDPVAASQLAVIYPGELPTLAVAFSPDGKLLATGAADGTIRLLPLAALPPPEEHLQRALRERGLRLVGTTLLDSDDRPAAAGG